MTKIEKMMKVLVEAVNISKALENPVIADGRKSDYERQAEANATGKAICFQGLSNKGKYPVKRVVLPMPVEGGVCFIRSGGCATGRKTTQKRIKK